MKPATILSSLGILALFCASCWQGRCPTDDPYALRPDPPAYTRAWFPYTSGQTFSLASSADTVACTILRAGTYAVEYDQGDECPTGRGNAIGGAVLIGSDTLTFQTGLYPDNLELRFRNHGFMLTDGNFYRYGDTTGSLVMTTEINGVIRPLTVQARVSDSTGTTAFFLTNRIGVSGVVRDGKTFGLVD